MKKIYLAIPYTGLEDRSYDIATDVAGKLMLEDNLVFSPITHSHAVAEKNNMPTTWEFWEKHDLPFIDWCDSVVVIVVGDEGDSLIDKSTGVQGELEYARKMGKDIEYYQYNVTPKLVNALLDVKGDGIYSGEFSDKEDVANNFGVDLHNIEILYADYDCPPYEGYAFVLFRENSKIYEVHGSHCSCFGLEDQWLPEEVSTVEMVNRLENGSFGSVGERKVIKELLGL